MRGTSVAWPTHAVSSVILKNDDGGDGAGGDDTVALTAMAKAIAMVMMIVMVHDGA